MKTETKKKIKKWFWIILTAPFACLALLLVLVWSFARIPSFEELENPSNKLATQVLAEDGQTLTTFHIENRTYASFEELSPYLVEAAVATEDSRFYSHSGIDFRGLARVGVKTILMHKTDQGGGSTISQQLAKTLYPRREMDSRIPGWNSVVMVWTKIKEWITAVKIERNYTKDEIVDMYLNSIFFGGGAYGIRAAAESFFAKEPCDLKIEEAAVLIGMINKPTRYNPVLHFDESLGRRNLVLDRMCRHEYISKTVCDSVKALPLDVSSFHVQDHNSGLAPYFRDMLRRVMNAKKPRRSDYQYFEDYSADSLLWVNDDLYGWLNKNKKPNGEPYNLDKDGLKIYTTLNYKMQKYAEEAVAEYLGKNLQPAFDKEQKWNSNRPFASDIEPQSVAQLMQQARRWSDRYRGMKKEGYSEEEILQSFKTPVKMRVFSWNGDGYIDTVMSPDDSIKYYKGILRAGFVAIEPGTGYVKAYVGGPNYRYFKYDNVRQGKRQVGSTIKPFLYTLAMSGGMTPCDKVVNVPQSFIVQDDVWTPRSTDKPEWIGKTVTIKWGLTHSSNNIAAYLMKQYGPQPMADMMHAMGIHSHVDAVPSLCVGTADISVFEMVSAYNTFPSKGVSISPLFVLKIEDSDGNTITEFTNRKKESVSEQTAYLMINLMQGVINNGTGSSLRSVYGLKGEIAGKTGTSNDHSDGWFIGYTPTITAGVWVGAEDSQVRFNTLALGSGAHMALPIWGLFMKKVLQDGTTGVRETDRFIAPAGSSFMLNCDGGDNDSTDGSNDEAEQELNYFFE